MDSAWAHLDADAPLTHAVTSRHQKRQQHVNEMTEMVARMRVTYLRLSNSLEQLDRTISESSKRLYSELTLAAGLYDRLDQLEEPIQFAQDQYELANTRLIEAKNAAREHLHAITEFGLELGIILLLVFQIRQFL
jgi:chromosome segregation ATPase